MAISVLNTDASLSGKTLLTKEGDSVITGTWSFSSPINAALSVSSTFTLTENMTLGQSPWTNGSRQLSVQNQHTGTSAVARILFGNANDSAAGHLSLYGSGFTTSGIEFQDGMLLVSARAGGLNLAATHASGPLRIYTGGNTLRWSVDSSGVLTGGTDAYMLMVERADPSAPAANSGVVYMRDNGAGKTQFVARFPSGAVQVMATEP
jgi:hypothetical protein